MRSRFWLNVALLAVVCALALLAYFRPLHGTPQQRLSIITAAQAQHITLERAGAPAIVLERTGAHWQLSAPFRARVADAQSERLLSILEAIAAERLPAQGLARYDLDPPQTRLTIDRQVFAFGAVNALNDEQYVQTEGGVYLVAPRYGALLPRSTLDLAAKELFAPDEIPIAFHFEDFSVAETDGIWRLSPKRDVGADDITRWVNGWRLASALAALPDSRRKPLANIKVTLKGGATLAFSVLERAPRLIVKRADAEYELQLAGAAGLQLLAPPAAAQ